LPKPIITAMTKEEYLAMCATCYEELVAERKGQFL
jgi:hypothetical protein